MLHGIYRYARRRSRLSAGIAIVIVLTLTSVLVGMAISSGPAAGVAGSAAGSAGALSKVKAVRPPGRSTPPAAKAHAAPAHHQPRPAAKAKPTRQAHPAKPAAKAAIAHSAHPYTFYDSVTPSAIPAHHTVATYVDGSYAVRPSQVTGRGPVLWIDVKGSDTSASVLDVEPGDATPAQAAAWARHKLSTQPKAVACIYTMRSEWAATRAAISKLPSQMCSRIRWWIADPTGVPHIVPGSHATQWYWGNNYDISSATASFPQLEK